MRKRSRRWSKAKRFLRRVKEGVVPLARYVGLEFAPFVAAYGAVVSVPMHFVFGFELSPLAVVSWGLLFYLVDEEVLSWVKELKPYVRVKVDE